MRSSFQEELPARGEEIVMALSKRKEMPHIRSAWQVHDYLLSTKHRPPPLRDSP